jgi:23S rRNA pseudouridine1911/1915/1917 synthase
MPTKNDRLIRTRENLRSLSEEFLVMEKKFNLQKDYQQLEFIVQEEWHNKRLDKFLVTQLAEQNIKASRSYLQNLIKNKSVFSDSAPINSAAEKLKTGQHIRINYQEVKQEIKKNDSIELNIVFEDEHLLVIDKQANLSCHPPLFSSQDTNLVNALLSHCGDNLSDISGETRPGILHRLDKNTSGLMVAAKTNEAHLNLAEQIKTRNLSRIYQAIIWGYLYPADAALENHLCKHRTQHQLRMVCDATDGNGKHAITHYKTLQIFQEGKLSLIECKLDTGRTHQIRVQLAHIGHNIFADPDYGNHKQKLQRTFSKEKLQKLNQLKRQALHSVEISFKHPVSNEKLTFASKFPQDISDILNIIT